MIPGSEPSSVYGIYIASPASIVTIERLELPVETREGVMYNAMRGKTLLLPVACPSSGGLAQLGEHYVRNVGVGGSTPLPSTKPHFV